MTTAALDRTASPSRTEGGYGFRTVAQMEWLKLRSVRSTWWTLLVFAAGMIGLAILVMIHQHWTTMSPPDRASFDPTNDSYAGLAIGQLALGVLGVLVISGEYGSGTIRSSLAAVPRRETLFAAKATVVGLVTLVLGEILAFGAFFFGQAILSTGVAPTATLGQPGVLRAVVMTGAFLSLFSLLGLGLGLIIRHTAGAIATFAAAPRRPLVLAAKAAIVAAVTLVAGEILAFVAFGVGEAVLKNPAPHASLGQPGVLRAVLMAGAYPALIALIGLGLGALIRHTAGAISAVVGVLFVLPLILVPLGTSVQNAAGQFMPMLIAENSLTAVKPVAHSLSPGVGFALLCGYAAAALAAGGWALARRDA